MRTSLVSFRVALLSAAGLGAAACELLPLEGTGGASNATGATMSTGASPSSTKSSGSNGHGGSKPVCEDAEPVLDHGEATGFMRCPDMTVHRVEPVTCDPTIDAPTCAGTESMITCLSDAECTAAPHGRCISTTVIDEVGVLTGCGCNYGCISDDECGPGKACVCKAGNVGNEQWAACVDATCRTGADCASNECGLSQHFDGCGLQFELGCRNPTDACRTNADCASGPGMSKTCALATSSLGGPPTWECLAWSCVAGRPLVIEGVSRRALPVAASAWSAPIATPSTSPEVRAALVSHWLEAAALEHASIASFARFTLQLLALGAPPSLVASAQSAALDEIEHARLAYGLASSHAGKAFGPGPLDTSGASNVTDRRAILASLIEEACVGESLGVADALVALEHVEEPELRAILARIAADEQRHAELAWRTLAWMLASSPDDRAFARACFATTIEVAAKDPPSRPVVAPEHGLLSSEAVGEARRRVLREVVEPTARALLG